MTAEFTTDPQSILFKQMIPTLEFFRKPEGISLIYHSDRYLVFMPFTVGFSSSTSEIKYPIFITHLKTVFPKWV